MVTRRLNVPIAKVQGQVAFWLTQAMTVEWRCRQCNHNCEKGSVAFEFCIEQRIPGMMGKTKESKVKKIYLCLPCAKGVLSSALNAVETCDRLGPDGFRFFQEV